MFNSAKEFVIAMMENEGFYFYDNYGREWMYQSYEFYFKDIGEEILTKKVCCLCLFSTIVGKDFK